MENIEEKQNYLRENVLEKGYDPNVFMEFLVSKKGEEAADLNAWTFDEIKSTVEEFTTNFQPSNPISSEVPVPEENKGEEVNSVPVEGQPQPENTQEGQEGEVPVDDNGNQLVRKPTEPYKQHLPCAKTEETEISKCDNLTITLSFPEKVEGGIFSKSYVTYLVTTMPFDYKVRKRYSDFEWLRSILQTLYIGSVIPPIPRKNYGDRFNEFFISKRMRFLEKFMQGLAVDPLIRNSQILYDFLTTENEQEWNNKKANYNKLRAPVKLSEIKTITGEMKLDISDAQETYFANIKDNANNNEVLIKKLLVSYKALLLSMIDTSNKMHETSEVWKQLFQNSQKYLENPQVTEVYSTMSKLFEDWAESEKRQASLINLEIREYMRYIKNEFRSMKELVTKADFNKTTFYKAEERLIWRKEDLFKRQEITRWELDPSELSNKLKLIQDKEYAFSKMLPKDSQHVLELKQWYGYYLNRIIDEYERIKDLNASRHRTRILSFSKSNTDIITDLHVAHADLISFFTENKKG